MNKKMMKKYAEIVVQEGINVQPGQDVVVNVSVNNTEFARYLVEEAYKAKARKVFVRYHDDAVLTMKVKYQKQKELNTLESFEIERMKYDAEKLPCYIHVVDSDPDGLSKLNMKKFNAMRKAYYPISKEYKDKMDNRYQWVIVAMPSVEWAKKVFPELPAKEAFNELERLIIQCMHLDKEDALKEWKKHKRNLKSKAKLLNRYHFDSLTYTSSNGTKFKVGLHPKHEWLSANFKHLLGNEYIANMPTEEVFTMPDKYRADGIVYSTKPLSYQGNLIEDFSIRFKKGKAVKVKAKVGQEYLEQMIAMDEGSAYLGEVALVPFNSPINKTEVLFYNTLFDENASCHLALGFGIKNSLKGYGKMTKEDLEKENYNDSMNHVDFMVGAEDLTIIGTTIEGEEVTVFENGIWAI